MSIAKYFPKNAGKTVDLSLVEKEIKVLAQADKDGCYYPMMALEQLGSLSSGLAKSNIYIPNINDSRVTGL